MFITQLRCEYAENPLGIDNYAHLSWRLATTRPGARQTAYRLCVAASPEKLDAPDLWDTGRVESDQTTFVPYGGSRLGLQPQQRYFWRVHSWDETGQEHRSEIAWWEMGLVPLKYDDFGHWIGGHLRGGPETSVPAPFLRRSFELGKPVKKARLYASAKGVYECELNGQRVGDQVFAPGWTDYNTRIQYQTYDVTPLLQSGENVWGAILGDGWYCGRIGWIARQYYGSAPQFWGRLEIEFEDNETTVIESDAAWQHNYGPILGSDMQGGEVYDARLEFDGWSQAGFDTRDWMGVKTEACVVGELPYFGTATAPPVRRIEELLPVREPFRAHGERGPWIFDLGQNMVGRVRLKVSGQAGQTVTLRFAEVLEGGPTATEGPIYIDNLRTAKQTDIYTLKGDGEETWEPRFTFHGFRYVEISGFPGTPTRDAITGIVLHSDLKRIGDFECSDPLINQLQKNIDWGWRGNSVDIPTDCPQRNERLGWTGDAQVFGRTAAFNHDVTAFFADWSKKIGDAQGQGDLPSGAVPAVVPNIGINEGGPAWADAVLICPWTIYRTSGDVRILRDNYASFENFMEFQQTTARDGLRCFDDYEGWKGYGDWLAIDKPPLPDGRPDIKIGESSFGNLSNTLIGTAFFAHDADLMARIATVLGKTEDAARYAALFEAIKAAFNREFVNEDGTIQGATQTAYLLALHFDLLPEAMRERAADELVNDIRARGNRLSTGFVGSPYLNHVLTETGHLDVAYDLLFQTEWPSWLYAVTNNATTIWERWDGWTPDQGFQDPGMNSFNHYAYGAIGAWLYQVVAGIELDPEVPGYQKFRLQPHPGGSLTWSKAHLDTLHGRIESEWHLENGAFVFDFVVPPNTSATVVLPNGDSFESGPGLHTVRLENFA